MPAVPAGDVSGTPRTAAAGEVDARPGPGPARGLVLGVGLVRGASPDDLRAAVDALGVDAGSVAVVATVDHRGAEDAVRALAAGRTLRTYPAAVLDTVDVPHPSATVRARAGTASVAEAAAILAARDAGGTGELVVAKQAGRGVTVALARWPSATIPAVTRSR